MPLPLVISKYRHGSHIKSYENNCLLTFLVDNMVQLFHHFIKITVSCHEIETLYEGHDQLPVYTFFALCNNIYWN